MNNFRLHTSLLNSNLWYEIFSYPAGEKQVRILKDYLPLIQRSYELILMASWPFDMIELALVCSALSTVNHNLIKVLMPYLPFSRADRRFTEGDCHGLDAFTSMVASIPGLYQIFTLDVHNESALQSSKIHNCPAEPFIQQAIAHVAIRNYADHVDLVFPDEGAKKRYKIGHNGYNIKEITTDSFFCSKHRDATTGKLLSFSVPALPTIPAKRKNAPVLIIDDICDGGGTFLGILPELLKQDRKVSLFTTHSMYSRGTDCLLDAGFDYLYTTNSFPRPKDAQTSCLLVYDSTPLLLKTAQCS